MAGRRFGTRCLWTGVLGLFLWIAGSVQATPLDVDGDGAADALSDGVLILRHLFGFSGDALTAGAVGDGALRDADAMAGYLSELEPALDIDGDGVADALTDGLLVLRYLFGFGGAALVADALSPDATRDASAITAFLDDFRSLPGQAPSRVELVQANSLTSDRIQLDWLPSFDNDTPGSRITYVLHAAEEKNFVPDATTARAEVLDDATGVIAGLTAATRYRVKVEARDLFGNRSWSNELGVVTAAADPRTTSALRRVLDNMSAPDQVVNEDGIEYRLGAGAVPPEPGDILVSGEGEGFLRRAAAVTRIGDQVSVDTEPAALNELFDNLSFSTDIKLVDLPDVAGPSARSVGRGVIFQRSGSTVRAVWPDSGLTLIEERPAEPSPRSAQPTPRASDEPIDCDGLSGRRISRRDGPLKVTFPEKVCVEPGSTLSIDITAEIEAGDQQQYQVTQLSFEDMDHGEIDEVYPKSKYGAQWDASIPPGVTYGKGMLRWTPAERHVDGQLRPYTARFVATAEERDGYCTGGYGLWCKDKKIEFEIDIGVTWGDLPRPGKQAFAGANADLSISGTAAVEFQPTIRVESDISWGGLNYGQVVIEGPIRFETEVNLHATAAASYEPDPKRLLNKRFIKIFQAGAVPIVVNGHFTLDLEFKANADAALDLTQTLDIGYDIEAGLEYKNGNWRLIEEARPWKRYELNGKADVHAYVELRFVPSLKIAFYDVATGRLILEPYLYAEADLEGHFLYQYLADGSGVEQDSDDDYRFTQLEFGGGVDGKFRAGLEVFDKSILAWPSDDGSDLCASVADGFCEFALIDRTRIIGIPTLDPQQGDSIEPTDSRAIALLGSYQNVLNPFRTWSDKAPESFKPFVDESAAWEPVLAGGGARTFPGDSPLDAWFTYTEPALYTLRFSGHSTMGSFIRQYEEIEIDLSDNDGDGMADAWESRWGVDDPDEDPDDDSYNNLQEFRHGLNPFLLDLDSDRFDLLTLLPTERTIYPTDSIEFLFNDEVDPDSLNASLYFYDSNTGAPIFLDSEIWSYHPGFGPSAPRDGSAVDFIAPPSPDYKKIFVDPYLLPGGAYRLVIKDTLMSVQGNQLSANHGIDLDVLKPNSFQVHGSFFRYSDDGSSVEIGFHVFSKYDATQISFVTELPSGTLSEGTFNIGSASTGGPGETGFPPCVVSAAVELNGGRYFEGNVNYTHVVVVVNNATAQTAGGSIAIKLCGQGGDCESNNVSYTLAPDPDYNQNCGNDPPSVGILNDTGIDRCADATHNNMPCPVDGYPGQDAEYGRDHTHNDDSDGHAGFSFTKLDANGNDLPSSAAEWSCVRDNVTGLIWEVKTDDGGLRDRDNTYTWYNPDSGGNGGAAGTQDGGSCTGGIFCDTNGYAEAVNAQGLCGARDWRMPDRRELMSIVANDRWNPAVDTAYFPHTRSSWFWSASSYAGYSDGAWGVYFGYGGVYGYSKYSAEHVRFVRGGQ